MPQLTCVQLSHQIFGVWNDKGGPDALLPLFTKDYVDHTAPPNAPSDHLEWLKMQYQMFTTAFPDIHFELVDVVGTGDKIGERIVVTGTHQGELMGIPPTGKKIEVTAMAVHVAENGLCKEVWFYLDQMAMMQQLGVV